MPTSTKFATNPRCGDLLKAMLASWNPHDPDPQLDFRANAHSCCFTREEFISIIEVVGSVTESWRAGIANSSGEVTSCLFFVVIYERKSHREAWVDRLLAAFPTWFKLGGLMARINERKSYDARCRSPLGLRRLTVFPAPSSRFVWKRSPRKRFSGARSAPNTASYLQVEASSSRLGAPLKVGLLNAFQSFRIPFNTRARGSASRSQSV